MTSEDSFTPNLSVDLGDRIGSIVNGSAPLLHPNLNAVSILEKAAQQRAGIICLQPNGLEFRQSYRELQAKAARILGGLRALGLKPQDKVILQLPQGADFLAACWGCWLGGLVPVPVAVSPNYAGDSSAQVFYRAWELCDRPLVISDRHTSFNSQPQVALIEDLLESVPDLNWHVSAPEDLALLLMTSGSTGIPKAVMLSHQNLLASSFGMAEVNGLSQTDISLNWMPLEHVASLVMFHFTQVYLGCDQIQVANELVLQNPLKWLDLCHQYRVTTTWSPNFAYGLVCDRWSAASPPDWDLSCLRWMGNGAEAVVGKTTRRFLQLLAPFGLAGTAVSPGYGMSETCSGIVHSHNFSLETTSDEDPFIELGSPIPGVSLRIVDEANRAVDSGTIGLLQVKGLTVTSGYYQRPDLNAEIFTADGWFNTGDLGFIKDGKLTITGRQKEVIIINGVNYYSHEIEAVVEEIEEINKSYTAACAVRREEDRTDKLAIFFDSVSSANELALKELIQKVRQQVISKIGINPDYLIPVAAKIIPKTAIGKIQRQQLSQRFAAGEFDEIVLGIKDLMRASDRPLPKTELEQKIAAIWEEVVGIERVSPIDNFFELGGNSLLLMQVLSRLQEELKQQLSAVELFQYPTIAALARHLNRQSSDVAASGQARARQRQLITRDVAVIGMSCRFPGAKNIDEFWQNLCNGVESIAWLSEDEILASGIAPELAKRPDYVKASPILNDIELFDAEFFGYSPKEAELIDPQQRLLLECAWESLENAGYNPLVYPGAIALYAGASANSYLLNHVYPNRHRIDELDDLQVVNLASMAGFQMTVANDKDYLTTRASYKLNLTGPSVNVQTACSTSLAAIHMAYQSLLNGECDIALAGGVSVQVPQKSGYLHQPGTILSPDGHCRAFDASAGGTLFGSGAGIVVLKRLSEAIADGDSIYGVIKGSALNNDGANKVGYMAPNGAGQTRVAAEAMAVAQIEPETITYVEAHGTGTALGDPIEIAALTEAFRASTDNRGFCAIGSVKTNFGHLNIASGVAGFLKAVLSIYHRQIPASLHFESPNPQIDFDRSPFYVNTELRDWQTKGFPRRAGVNSLGIGGTNVHVILEEAPQRVKSQASSECHLLALSARNEKALRELAQKYVDLDAPEVSLADICWTANTGRSHFDYRLAVVASSIGELQSKLADFVAEAPASGLVSSKAERSPKIAFLFTGQGSQYPAMGEELYRTEPAFKAALEQCAEILAPYLDVPLLELLYSPDNRELLDRTAYTQPILFALEYALFQLWHSWGIISTAVAGHSLGEYVAACVAGVFSLEDGLKLIAARGKLMQELPQKGVTIAVFAGEGKVRPLMAGYRKVAIAAVNSANNTVISGDEAEILEIVAALAASGIKTTPLKVSHAFHSPLMEPMLDDFARVASQIDYSLPEIDLISNATGEVAGEEIATPGYWRDRICDTVRFADSMATLERQGYGILVEIGAKPTLIGMWQSESAIDCLLLPSLRPQESDRQQMLQSLAQLYVKGVGVDWQNCDRHYFQSRVALPTYPFQRQRYWMEAAPRSMPVRRPSASGNPLLGGKVRSPLQQIIFESQISANFPAFLQDHRIFEDVVLPGTAYLEMALAAGEQIFPARQVALINVDLQQKLVLSREFKTVQIVINKNGSEAAFEVYSLSPDEDLWHLHASGKIAAVDSSGENANINQLQASFSREISPQDYYRSLKGIGIEYGDSFKLISRLWQGDRAALGLIQAPSPANNYRLHPAALDACFQVIFAALPTADLATYIPVGVESLEVYDSLPVWSHIKLHPVNNSNPEAIVADAYLYDETGKAIAVIKGLRAQRINAPTLLTSRLEITDRGTLDNLQWQQVNRLPPDAGEIEIKVRAAGLNFRDVLNALGLYPGDPGLVGLECAGEVVAVGSGVEIQVGDAVVAIASGISQYVTVNANLAVPKPKNLCFDAAATIPTAFLTASYTLHHLAKIAPGDRVLIHAGAGGVGIAAIQLAQKAGAEVFATASPTKWEFLKSLGVEHISNSRTLDFAQEIAAITQGEGVDIVLNSLAGDFIPQSLSLLRDGGRFLEIGKNGVWSAAQVAEIKPNISYFLVDLVEVTQQQPKLMQSMLRELVGQFESRSLQPLPQTVFPRDRAVDAFRYMQQAKHIGKIVISFAPTSEAVSQADNEVKSDFLTQLAAATDPMDMLLNYARDRVAKMLGIEPPSAIDLDLGLSELGMDSLRAIELRNYLQSNLACTLPATFVFDYATIAEITDYLAERLGITPKATVPDGDAAIDAIAQLTEAEAEALLLEELENLR